MIFEWTLLCSIIEPIFYLLQECCMYMLHAATGPVDPCLLHEAPGSCHFLGLDPCKPFRPHFLGTLGG